MSDCKNGLKDNENSLFVRALIVCLSLFITFLITYNFIFASPKGEINTGIIVLLAFLIILSLSESFNNFSVGKIFSLQKTVKENNSDISQLRTENLELRNQIVKISTSVSQGQMNATVVNLPEILSQLLKVKAADKEEIKEKEEIEEKENISETLIQRADLRKDNSRKRIDYGKMEDLGLNKFIDDYKLHHYNLIKDAKLSMEFYNIDPISDLAPLFDGYIKTPESDLFIEVKQNFRYMFNIKDRLYVMLNKVYHYKNIKKTNASLVLILINTKENEGTNISSEEFNRFFEPAISSGLLKIITYTLDESESSQIYKNEI